MKILAINKIEDEYKKRVNAFIEQGNTLNAKTLVDLSISLFKEFKVKAIDTEEDEEYDMLLFQYGVYTWGDSLEKHFVFDITRQIIDPDEDEPYQLSLKLIFEATEFKSIESYNCWSTDFDDLNEWIQDIKESEGYALIENKAHKLYEITFSQM